MDCIALNVDWCWVLKSLFLNKIFLIGLPIITVGGVYLKFKYQIRSWWIKKNNPKHIINAIFINKEGCISIIPYKTEQQKLVNVKNESYMLDDKAIYRASKFKENITDLCKGLNQYKTQFNISDKKEIDNICNEIKKYNKEYKLPEQKNVLNVIAERLKKLESYKSMNDDNKNIINDIVTTLNKLEDYSIQQDGLFHAYHGKRWFWKKESTGEAFSIYVDGISTPILKQHLIDKKKAKWDATVIYNLANQTFLRQFLTDSGKINWKTLLFVVGGGALAIYVFYTVQTGGKLI